MEWREGRRSRVSRGTRALLFVFVLLFKEDVQGSILSRACPGPKQEASEGDTRSTGELENAILAMVMRVNRKPPKWPFPHLQLGSQIPCPRIQDRDKTALLFIHSLGRVERRYNGEKSPPNWDQAYFEPCLYLTRHVTPGRFRLFVKCNFSSESEKKEDLLSDS